MSSGDMQVTQMGKVGQVGAVATLDGQVGILKREDASPVIPDHSFIK